MRPTVLWLTLVPLALAACAPRASKRGPQAPVAAAVRASEPAVAASAAPAPAAQAAPAPAADAAPPPAWKPAAVAAAPAPADDEADDEQAEAAGDADEAPAPAPAPAARTGKRGYYAFTKAEITALKKQSREFKKLDHQLEVCARKAAQGIERREEIPAEIAKIRMSKGGLTPDKERKIDKLKAEQTKLKSADLAQCAAIEDRLTAMLQSTYDAESALY